MNESPDTLDDDGDNDEEEAAETERRIAEYETAIEAELCEAYGPPEVREAKTAAYCAELCERWGEPEIRRLLLRFAEDPDTLAVQMLLDDCDLAADPLTKIIRPYDCLGFRFEIMPLKDNQDLWEIRFGRSHGTVGDGGLWSAKLDDDGKFQILNEWRSIC